MLMSAKRNQNIEETERYDAMVKENFAKERGLWNNWASEETIKEDESALSRVFTIIREWVWTIVLLLVIVRLVRGFEYLSCTTQIRFSCMDESIRKYTPVCNVKCDFKTVMTKSRRKYYK